MASTELSAATRARILETALADVREHGAGALSVTDLASAAGVSRQLVYFHFGSRAGLISAMARHADRASGFVARALAAQELAGREGLAALLRAWFDYLPELEPVARALEAALVAGDEGGEAWRERMGRLREGFRRVFERLEREGGLAPGWSVEAAADWTWSRVQPSAFAHLVHERGWTPDAFAQRTTATLVAELVSAPRARPRGRAARLR